MVPITTLCVIPIQRYRHLYLRRFQFHKGAIRTHFSCSHSANFRYFNSIKVRLEQTMLMPLNPTSKNFNSIKVRLELVFDSREHGIIIFQFHKGAIRTKLPKTSLYYIAHFNSIKVRLERRSSSSSCRCRTFQFNKGAIRTP